jgi:hypothetical protein
VKLQEALRGSAVVIPDGQAQVSATDRVRLPEGVTLTVGNYRWWTDQLREVTGRVLREVLHVSGAWKFMTFVRRSQHNNRGNRQWTLAERGARVSRVSLIREVGDYRRTVEQHDQERFGHTAMAQVPVESVGRTATEVLLESKILNSAAIVMNDFRNALAELGKKEDDPRVRELLSLCEPTTDTGSEDRFTAMWIRATDLAAILAGN